MDGHADSAPETGGLSDLASFLADTLETEPADENEATNPDESTAEGDTDNEENDQQDESEGDEPEDEEDAEPAPDRKVTIKTTAEDGTETTEEVSETELVKGYQRQADYTRKTQALAERETKAVEFIKGKHDEMRDHYLTQAETARAAVSQMAGLKSGEEMAQLANSDPAAWVAENQRQQSIGAFLNGLEQRIASEKENARLQSEQHQQQQKQTMFTQTWAELEKAGIDKPKLAKIFGGVTKAYGVSEQELASVYDHRYVNIMKDAIAFRELQAKKTEVTKKVADAPRMPSRQAQPAQERRDKALNDRFKGGRAKLNDLAAYLR